MTMTAVKEARIRILATSDLHGKFVPWNYLTNEESTSGSLAQLSSAVKEYRNDHTLLLDAGDSLQDNLASLFAERGGIHPMTIGMNAIGYDICLSGNHDYDYGMAAVKQYLRDLTACSLTGNVYDENGARLADGYVVKEVDGVRVAVIGMTTPVIALMNRKQLEGCTVTDPLEETRAILEEIEGSYDVLIGLYHMGLNAEYNIVHSSVTEICEECPQFDLVIASHEHELVVGTELNGVLTVMNRDQARTMSVIDLTLRQEESGWKIVQKKPSSVDVGTYPADPELVTLLQSYDEAAKQEAGIVIGELTGVDMVPEQKIEGLPVMELEPTPLANLILDVMRHYSGAAVASFSAADPYTTLEPGPICKSDISKIYKFGNHLSLVRMNGEQLKQLMEWNSNYFNTVQKGDCTASIRKDMQDYYWQFFGGVRYEINLSKEPGERVERLTWMDGTPVRKTDTFDFACTDYMCNTLLLNKGALYEADAMPELVEPDVHGEIGGIRELIGDYIMHVKNGRITPDREQNWKLTGFPWNEEIRKRVEAFAARDLIPQDHIDAVGHLFRAVTEQMLKKLDQ